MKKILFLLLCPVLLSALVVMARPSLAADPNDFFALTSSAEQGDPVAQYNLGLLYLKKQDSQSAATAATWFEKSASQGNTPAALALADLHATGSPDLQDYAAAAAWYRKAADQGDAEAQYKLGNLYANGQGVKQAYDQAYFWYLLASGNGNEDASKNLEQTAGMVSPAQITEAKARAANWKGTSAPAPAPAKDQ